MIGAGTKDLALGLAQVATQFAAEPGHQGVWILDKEGDLLSSGGACTRDGEVEFALIGDALEVVGLPASRICQSRLVTLPCDGGIWVVLTDDAVADPAGLREFGDEMAGAFEREARRDYEAEDTTEHLLSCFEQIRAVHDLSDRLPGCESVDEMARLCLESLLLALGVRLGALVLRQEGVESGRALIMGDQGDTFWNADIPSVDSGHGPVAEAFREAKVRYGSVDSFDVPAGSLEAEALDWMLIVPICFGSEPDVTVLGCLVLMDRSDPSAGAGSPFGNPEAELTQSVGVLLGLALGTRMRAAAEKELQIARTIQETLIPASGPSWTGVDLAGRNRAANLVGGDYFDYLESHDARRHLVIADVSGHNMASAMAMVMARSQLRAVLAQESEPGAIVGTLARGLYGDLVRNELFITMFMLTLVEQKDGTTVARFTNAGHNPPLLLRADGTSEWLDGGGPMVGFMPEVAYDEHEVVLSPRDLIVLYTDGVTEVTNQTGEMLDETGLAQVVTDLASCSAGEILSGIFEAVDGHSGARQGEDDVTAVVIKALGAAEDADAGEAS